MKINGVTVTNGTFNRAFLSSVRDVEAKAQQIRNDLDYRAGTDHPNPAYRADPGDLASVQRSYDQHGYDPQGYPKGWTGPREVGTDWKPRTWAERHPEQQTGRMRSGGNSTARERYRVAPRIRSRRTR